MGEEVCQNNVMHYQFVSPLRQAVLFSPPLPIYPERREKKSFDYGSNQSQCPIGFDRNDHHESNQAPQTQRNLRYDAGNDISDQRYCNFDLSVSSS